MKDKNGIEKKCSNCRYYEVCASNEVCEKYTITIKAYKARIADLEKKLTETIKLLSEQSRECGKLEALLEVKNRSDMSTQSTDAADVSKNGEK